jgi:Zn-dependent protease
MTHKCSNCGFRSSDVGFFRREKGGLLNRPQPVCEGCVPYRPTPYERRVALRVLAAPATFLLPIFGTLGKDPEQSLFLTIMVATSIPTLPLRILIHEAGHAFAARLVGQVVWQARIGSGPIRKAFRAGGVVFEIRAIPWTGGFVRHFSSGHPASRLSRAFITAAGPLANLLTAVVALGFSYLCQGIGVLAAAFAGFGLFSLFVGVYNLIPRRFGDNETVASDGRQLLNLLKPQTPPSPLARRMQDAAGYSYMGRYDDAVATAMNDWQSTPLKLFFANQILHNLSRGRGDRAAIDFYLANAREFEDHDDADADTRSGLAWIWANIAWSAVKLGDPAFSDLAKRLVDAAIAIVPDRDEFRGTYGAWLVSVSRSGEGVPLLVQAARGIDNNIDKADFCDFIARAWRQENDPQRAATYDALAAHLRTKP